MCVSPCMPGFLTERARRAHSLRFGSLAGGPCGWRESGLSAAQPGRADGQEKQERDLSEVGETRQRTVKLPLAAAVQVGCGRDHTQPASEAIREPEVTHQDSEGNYGYLENDHV